MASFIPFRQTPVETEITLLHTWTSVQINSMHESMGKREKRPNPTTYNIAFSPISLSLWIGFDSSYQLKVSQVNHEDP